ncbi:MAG: Ulp1 family isopeptidase [Gammaproteobacteria bacterium]
MWGKPFEFLSQSVNAFIDWSIGATSQRPGNAPEPLALVSALPERGTRSTAWYATFRIEDYLRERLKNNESIAFWGSCSIFNTAACKALYNAKTLTENQRLKQILPYYDKQILIFLDNASAPASQGSHWQIYVFNKADCKLYKFDGLNWSAREGVVAEIKNHLKTLWPEDVLEIDYRSVDIPKQPNQSDCGPAVCWIVDRIASEGLQSLLDWTQSYTGSAYDYGAFRASVDTLIGPEPKPLLPDSKDIGKKRRTSFRREAPECNPICIDLNQDSDSDSGEPCLKRKKI